MPTASTSVALAPAPSLAHHRVGLDPEAAARLPRRQLAWTLAQTAAALGLAATGLGGRAPELGLALALGLGATASAPRRAPQALAVALGAGLLGLLAGAVGEADSTLALLTDPVAAATWARPGLDALQVLVVGAAVGAGLPWLERRHRPGPADHLHGALAGAAAVALATWAGATIGGLLWTPTVAALVGALVSALVMSQALVVAGLRSRASQRIPSPAQIRATLSPARQRPALAAAALDAQLSAASPDADTRDGLGEVAAWVYRLQWTLSGLDRERDSIGGIALEQRILEQTEAAMAAGDTLTRERHLATVSHLERMRHHRETIEAERGRTAALSDYALAYLEEARLALALAQVQPGDHTPDRLGDVLHRLRAHAAERAAQRSVARELAPTGAA